MRIHYGPGHQISDKIMYLGKNDFIMEPLWSISLTRLTVSFTTPS